MLSPHTRLALRTAMLCAPRAPQGRRTLRFDEGLARKLALDTTLYGHAGCVNRLSFNEEGTLLASCSDDCQVGCSSGRWRRQLQRMLVVARLKG